MQFNSLLTTKFLMRTKAVAYADDLLIATRGKSVREVENFANLELSKIETWSRRNKVRFNEKKSKVMLVTRRKRREDKEIMLYLYSNPIEQVTQMKYLGIILDQKFKFQEHKICGREVHKADIQGLFKKRPNFCYKNFIAHFTTF